MAVRFAGDFFGVPLTPTREDEQSTLLGYFPELKTIKRREGAEEDKSARAYGGLSAVQPFTGFKTLSTAEERKTAVPVFPGFKTFEQPK